MFWKRDLQVGEHMADVAPCSMDITKAEANEMEIPKRPWRSIKREKVRVSLYVLSSQAKAVSKGGSFRGMSARFFL